ncbi:PIN domain-containing protein [candidate division KSB1 bacterium]|nr:PIN domain-containing protein [candidate division KSB1 bacterium]
MDGLRNEYLVLSTQVLSEFYVTVTKKLRTVLSPETTREEIRLLQSLEIIEIDYQIIIRAINISQNHQISYWDAMIIAAAQKAECSILFSEDLNHEQIIESIRIINPFF